MSERAEIWLMVDPVGDQVIPVSTRVFAAITGPKSRVLARNCVALFLDPRGTVRRIETIEAQARGALTNLRLWAGRPVPARYIFETVDAPLEDLRTMIFDALRYQGNTTPDARRDWWLWTAPEARPALEAATTLAGLHAAIQFPEEARCLELL